VRRPRGRRIVSSPWGGRLVSFGSAVLAAVVAALLAPAWIAGLTRSVTIYDAGAAVLIVVLWLVGMQGDARDTARRAAAEDPGRNVVLTIVLLSSIAGLSAAIAILGHGPHVHTPAERTFVYGLGMLAVVAGWFVIHTMFTFRYAHLYYYDSDEDGSAQRGLKFPGTDDPNDYDFAYFSFVIGMTFQVSDVQIVDGGMRRLVLAHGLISFAYNSTIIALVINIISGLFH
jgi:uncharacterized membrane protein